MAKAKEIALEKSKRDVGGREMREVLFKAKRRDNHEWIVGYYCKYGDNHCIIEPTEFGLAKGVGIVPETLCEYTNLTDKNGKRIWENDIVHLTDVRYETEWRAIVEFGNPYGEYTWGWNFYHIGEKAKVNTDILLWAEMEDVEVYCEVIGNRFDNPELLTAER